MYSELLFYILVRFSELTNISLTPSTERLLKWRSTVLVEIEDTKCYMKHCLREIQASNG